MIVYIWTIAATIGAVIAAWNFVDAWRDLRALNSDRNGRRILALGWVRREAIRGGIQVDWAIVGILVLLGIGSALIAPMLVASAIAVAVNTLLDAQERRQLRRIIQ